MCKWTSFKVVGRAPFVKLSNSELGKSLDGWPTDLHTAWLDVTLEMHLDLTGNTEYLYIVKNIYPLLLVFKKLHEKKVPFFKFQGPVLALKVSPFLRVFGMHVGTHFY